ncbi:hypothetical protein G6F23_014027 [Rhizopus arrhizus]|nr:hypothetical protein G6F23_014027 [Rhizopus arrhizus]
MSAWLATDLPLAEVAQRLVLRARLRDAQGRRALRRHGAGLVDTGRNLDDRGRIRAMANATGYAWPDADGHAGLAAPGASGPHQRRAATAECGRVACRSVGAGCGAPGAGRRRGMRHR